MFLQEVVYKLWLLARYIVAVGTIYRGNRYDISLQLPRRIKKTTRKNWLCMMDLDATNPRNMNWHNPVANNKKHKTELSLIVFFVFLHP